MAEDVTSKLRSVSVEQIKNRKYFTKVWSVPARCDLKYVCFNWNNCPTLSIPFNERGKIIYPLDGLDITSRDSCELEELEKQAMRMLSKVNLSKYKNLKLKISYEEPLGDIELELVNGAGRRVAYYSRKANTVMFRQSDVHDSLFSAGDIVDEIIDGELVETGFISYHDLDDLDTVISGIESVEEDDMMFEKPVMYHRYLTDTPSNMKKFIRNALAKQPSDTVGDFSDTEINEILDSKGKKVLPKYINGLRFIGTGEPHLKLESQTVAFSEDAENEKQLADAIFGRRRDLSKKIDYHEIYDYIQKQEGAFDSLPKEEKAKVKKDYKQRMRQLNSRIGSMLGLGEEKALTSVFDGIAVNHHLLKPKN